MKRLLAPATNPHSCQPNPDLLILKTKVKDAKQKLTKKIPVPYTSSNFLKDPNSSNKNFLVNN